MKIYEALYNPMIYESGDMTISIHKTKQGARNALAKYIWKERKKHYSIYKSHGGTIEDDEPAYKIREKQLINPVLKKFVKNSQR